MSDKRWLVPTGGLGDIFMSSSALKLKYDQDPAVQYWIARRNRFMDFFIGHPAVAGIGFPPKGSDTKLTMYWDETKKNASHEAGAGLNRPFQLLAKKFGLTPPVEENYYFPGDESLGPILERLIPWSKTNIIVAPFSDSHKKNMNLAKWHQIVHMLKQYPGINVLQTGVIKEPYIKGTFSLLGLTTPGQLFGLLRKCQLLITADSFIMHAAHYTKTPTIALWGPTVTEAFGYPEHVHFKPDKVCEWFDPCMGRNGQKELSRYHEPCHLPPEQHCMEELSVEKIVDAAKNIVSLA
jgi:ADP-heptose:LPS heptosyltransferase